MKKPNYAFIILLFGAFCAFFLNRIVGIDSPLIFYLFGGISVLLAINILLRGRGNEP